MWQNVFSENGHSHISCSTTIFSYPYHSPIKRVKVFSLHLRVNRILWIKCTMNDAVWLWGWVISDDMASAWFFLNLLGHWHLEPSHLMELVDVPPTAPAKILCDCQYEMLDIWEMTPAPSLLDAPVGLEWSRDKLNVQSLARGENLQAKSVVLLLSHKVLWVCCYYEPNCVPPKSLCSSSNP